MKKKNMQKNMGYENTCASQENSKKDCFTNQQKILHSSAQFQNLMEGLLFFFIFQLGDCQLFDLQKKKR